MPRRENPDSSVSPPRDTSIEEDRAAVARILGGCVETWQQFVTGYSNLILKSLRGVLFLENNDEVYGVYADLLQDLYDGKLEKYEGRASLSTWLVLVARGHALDYLRHKRGRPRPPRGYQRLTEFEKLVYRWHFVEGVSYDATLEVLNIGPTAAGTDELTAAITTIEEVIAPRTLRRLDRERAARSAGHGSWREMEYFTHMRMEYARRSEEGGSEVIRRIEDDENRRGLARGREALTRNERQVVDLRFEEGLTAGEISRRVGWASPRRVYSLIESALNKFRKEMIRSTEK